MKKLSDKVIANLKTISDDCDKEDRSTRERQIRTWKRLKLLWEGFTQVWYSEVAHDWRIFEPESNTDQSSYDKPINVFRAYLESIIAALSVLVPPVKCYPDDADNPLDLSTARAGEHFESGYKVMPAQNPASSAIDTVCSSTWSMITRPGFMPE